jgi:hypothetical protein
LDVLCSILAFQKVILVDLVGNLLACTSRAAFMLAFYARATKLKIKHKLATLAAVPM